jgi:hypothetical protein
LGAKKLSKRNKAMWFAQLEITHSLFAYLMDEYIGSTKHCINH